MKYTVLLFMGLLLLTNCDTKNIDEATTESQGIIEAAQSDNKVKVYNGTIAGKYDMDVQLITDQNKIQGFYNYTKEGLLLPIKGVKREDNKVELSVYDETGGTVELFIGTINEGTIKGEWFNKREDANNETATFTFTEKSSEVPQEDLKSLQGTYEYTVEGYSNFIIIEVIGNKTVKIQAIITYGSCTGEVKGEAYVYNKNQINYFGEDNCFLNLYFDKNIVTATEISCTYYHGFGCIFDGKYRKVSNAFNWVVDS